MSDVPDRDMPDRDMPDRDMPDRDMPDGDMPDGDMPDRDMPDGDASHVGHWPEESKDSAGSNGQTALSIREAAARMGRSEAAIYHLIATGQLPAQPTASRGLSIYPTDLEQLERHGSGSRRSEWSVQSLWKRIRQRGQATVRRLRAGMRFLVPHSPPDYPSLPWYWIMPCCFCRAALAPHW
jgi:hypothetical protein